MEVPAAEVPRRVVRAPVLRTALAACRKIEGEPLDLHDSRSGKTGSLVARLGIGNLVQCQHWAGNALRELLADLLG